MKSKWKTFSHNLFVTVIKASFGAKNAQELVRESIRGDLKDLDIYVTLNVLDEFSLMNHTTTGAILRDNKVFDLLRRVKMFRNKAFHSSKVAFSWVLNTSVQAREMLLSLSPLTNFHRSTFR